MPTYVYECKRCGHTFELVQSMTDPPRKRCPECRGTVQRVFHPVGIVFKGSGFYKTDSTSTARKSAASSDDGKKADTAKDTKDAPKETKKETKSETKTDAKAAKK